MIAVRHIVKRFGGLLALNDCTFEVAPGSITGLIGPNGAGKTTLFNIITGFLAPDSGQVLMAGQDITGLPPHRLFARGLVRSFQIPHELARMTARENLMLVPAGQSGERIASAWFAPGRVRREERAVAARADEVLDFLGLAALANELAGNLSGGQKKLLELGRVMMTEAKMVLLDEPGAGVNRTLLAKLAGDIKRLRRERGYTFCVIEHDMDFVAALCDPVVVMAEGRVLTEGKMEAIRHDRAVQEAYLGAGAGYAAIPLGSAHGAP
jgi:branched-chain amino acid transport system ATP-binding protein